MSRRRILVDFDGVIHKYSQGWQGPEPTEPPVPGVRIALTHLIQKGWEVVIFTTRADTSAGKNTVALYCKNYRIPYHDITDRKLPAVVLVDDRAVTFKGDWSITQGEIDQFQSYLGPDKPFEETPKKPIQYQPVQSSNIKEVGYDPESLTLGVRFVSGKEYRYLAVLRVVYEEFLASPSAGSYFATNIKPYYNYEEGSV